MSEISTGIVMNKMILSEKMSENGAISSVNEARLCEENEIVTAIWTVIDLDELLERLLHIYEFQNLLWDLRHGGIVSGSGFGSVQEGGNGG
jgi:hypothetical protein